MARLDQLELSYPILLLVKSWIAVRMLKQRKALESTELVTQLEEAVEMADRLAGRKNRKGLMRGIHSLMFLLIKGLKAQRNL